MLINKDYLKSLSPCEKRYKNYLTHYKDWTGSLEEFFDLPELTHDDKKWVFVRSIDKDKLRLVAADFAERVLHIFESKYPNDDRPRKAIEAARNGDDAAAVAARVAANAAASAAAASAYAANAAYANAASAYAYAANADAYAASAANAAYYAAAYVANAASAYANAANAANAASAYATNAAAASAYAANAAYAYAASAYAYAAADAHKDEEKAQIEIMKKYACEALKGGE